MSSSGGRGKVRGHQVRSGVVERQERGLYQVNAACLEFFKNRGMPYGPSGNDFMFGSKDRSHRAKKREEGRLDRIAADLGQEEI